MHCLSSGRLATLICASLGLTLLPSAAHAADAAKPEGITFETFDKVELQGDWYPSPKEGKKSPAALVLHKLGSDRKAMAPLAEKLQEAGYAVLTFDFRGHGASTSVTPGDFWKVASNVSGIKVAAGDKKKDTITEAQFQKTYWPMLVNDIVAAKLFLEKKNNAGECNVSDMVVVGVDDGATLGQLWLFTEWDRRRNVFNPVVMAMVPNADPEGKDIAAAVWLSMRTTVGPGTRTFSLKDHVDKWFKGSAEIPKTDIIREKVGFCLIYGADDAASSAVASHIFDRSVLNGENLPLAYKVALKKTKLAGADLFGADLDTEKVITTYLTERVFAKRKTTVWSERDWIKTYTIGEVPLKNRYRIAIP